MNRQSAKPLKGFPPPKHWLLYEVFITSTVGLRIPSGETSSPQPSRAGCDELLTIRVHVLPCGLASCSPQNLPPRVTLPSDPRRRRDLLKVGYWRRNAADMSEALTSVC